ncbi:MAG TPA: hypothetical protein DCS43_09870 [Verrucomicrobia bacterium]|nr:hypothetical protein [Verrucomicrobiota bacterium]
MEIANPIYDAVFKFLMEDKKAASLMIGAITGFDIEFPEECQVLLRRLSRAVAEQEIRKRMDVEDEIVTEFEMRDRREDELKEIVEAERRQKAEAVARETEAVAREAEAVARETEERRQKEEERRQKEEALAELEKLRRQLGQR